MSTLSIREKHIDRLLSEEFECSCEFARWFAEEVFGKNNIPEGTPRSLTAATRYSGRWSRSGYNEHLQQLQSALERDGLRAVGEPRFARFDPPMKPWFLRRNEVHIDVEDTADVEG